MKIATDGYRGPLTDNAYMPPGEYRVVEGCRPHANPSEGICSRELADYLLGIEMARSVEGGPDTVMFAGDKSEPVAPEDESADPIRRTPEEFASDMMLTSDDIDGMLKDELIDLAEKLDIDSSGNKPDLQARLKKHVS
jgi:hypothetical protein